MGRGKQIQNENNLWIPAITYFPLQEWKHFGAVVVTELSFLGFILWIEPYEKTSCAKAESANKQLVLSKNF